MPNRSFLFLNYLLLSASITFVCLMIYNISSNALIGRDVIELLLLSIVPDSLDNSNIIILIYTVVFVKFWQWPLVFFLVIIIPFKKAFIGKKNVPIICHACNTEYFISNCVNCSQDKFYVSKSMNTAQCTSCNTIHEVPACFCTNCKETEDKEVRLTLK